MTVDEVIAEVFLESGVPELALVPLRVAADLENPAIVSAGRMQLKADEVEHIRAMMRALLKLPAKTLEKMRDQINAEELKKAGSN